MFRLPLPESWALHSLWNGEEEKTCQLRWVEPRVLLSVTRCMLVRAGHGMKLEQNRWTKLPEYTTMLFSMTSLANRLVLVGGGQLIPLQLQASNQLAVFESGEWTHPYPPMNMGRYCATAVSFNNHIIVAGGHDDNGRISVEVLDVASRRWYIAQSLPHPQNNMASVLVEKRHLYLMGGDNCKTVHLNELVAKAISCLDTPSLWQTIEDTPLEMSSPLSIGRSLLAVGGHDDKSNPSSSIHLYQPDTRRWVKVGDLLIAQYSCTCSVLPSGEIIVAGGMTDSFTNMVDFLSISSYN